MNIPKSLIKDKFLISKVIFGIAAVVLAIDPILWLVRTWGDPSYDSSGFIVFCVSVGLFLWSVTSDRIARTVNLRLPFVLLSVSALTRMVGQVLAINVIGAITLVLDVYAIGHLAAVGCRKRPISPGWLAICFAFSLPLEKEKKAPIPQLKCPNDRNRALPGFSPLNRKPILSPEFLLGDGDLHKIWYQNDQKQPFYKSNEYSQWNEKYRHNEPNKPWIV